jgi:hypothetical protein
MHINKHNNLYTFAISYIYVIIYLHIYISMHIYRGFANGEGEMLRGSIERDPEGVREGDV